MTRGRVCCDDRGAALILALGFVLMAGVVSAALLSFITTSVSHRPQLDAVRNRQYAADAAVEHAIAQVRALASPGETSCGPYTYPSAPSPASINGVRIHVDCRNTPGSVIVGSLILGQRNVVFTSCLYTGTGTGAPCTDSTTIIRAQVNFQAPPGSPVTVTRTYIQSWSVNS